MNSSKNLRNIIQQTDISFLQGLKPAKISFWIGDFHNYITLCDESGESWESGMRGTHFCDTSETLFLGFLIEVLLLL